jgi:hypothetical protein
VVADHEQAMGHGHGGPFETPPGGQSPVLLGEVAPAGPAGPPGRLGQRRLQPAIGLAEATPPTFARRPQMNWKMQRLASTLYARLLTELARGR